MNTCGDIDTSLSGLRSCFLVYRVPMEDDAVFISLIDTRQGILEQDVSQAIGLARPCPHADHVRVVAFCKGKMVGGETVEMGATKGELLYP